jgi:Kef-type K+ transport system membrane component KefB
MSQLNLGNILVSGINIAFISRGHIFDRNSATKNCSGSTEKYRAIFKRLQRKEAAFGVMLISAIAISLIAQNIGLHFIIGTFFSDLVIYKGRIGLQDFNRVYMGPYLRLHFGFFVHIFFALIGIEFNIRSLVHAIPLFLALLGIAIVTKIAARYIGAKIVRFSREVSLAIGFLMNGRGRVELVIASIGFVAGVIDMTLFSISVAIGLVTSIQALVTSRPTVSSPKSKGSNAVLIKDSSGKDWQSEMA